MGKPQMPQSALDVYERAVKSSISPTFDSLGEEYFSPEQFAKRVGISIASARIMLRDDDRLERVKCRYGRQTGWAYRLKRK